MRWVLGSMGPGTKLPSLGHTSYDYLKQTFALQAGGLIDGGADAFLIETSQDLLQTKAAVNGCKQAIVTRGIRLPIFVEVTVETTGTMLMGSEIGAALTALEPLGVDAIGLNCATGPGRDERAPAPPLQAVLRGHRLHAQRRPPGPRRQRRALSADAQRTRHRARAVRARIRPGPGGRMLRYDAGAPGRRRRTSCALRAAAAVTSAGAARVPTEREAGIASLYHHVKFDQESAYLAIGERTNANGSKAFRQAMLDERWDDCVDIAREQVRVGAHLLDVCIDYVGRDGVADIKEVVSRFASASTLPLVIDSTEPPVLQAGLELHRRPPGDQLRQLRGRRRPGSRFARIMPLVKEHGTAVIALTIDEQGQARTTEGKVAIASRLIDSLVGEWGMRVEDIIVDALTFPIATGQEETRRDGIETIEAIRQITAKYPGIHTTLGVSNVSFGLNPAARIVLNSVFLHEAVEAGLSTGIIDAAKIVPLASLPEEQRKVALDLVWDRREYDADGNITYDPLAAMLDLFAGVDTAALKDQRAAELAALPMGERLERRIIDGEGKGLEADLDLARAGGLSALQIINDHLLEGMKVVGERFGAGEMQLPFVLQSAEVMKTAVALLEPHMEKSSDAGKGTIVLATVRGDVHDIGKNLVDIILTNNGYDVINIGIKQPIADIIAAAEEHDADVIGMSGLLVKSTVVMKENLQELQSRGLGEEVAGHPRRRRADPRLRRTRSGRAVRRRGPVRQRRVRGPGAHGTAGGARPRRLTRRRRPSAAEEAHPHGRRRVHGDRTGGHARPLRRGRRQPRAGPAVLGHAHRARRRARRLRRVPRRAGHVHGAVGAQARPRRGRRLLRGTGGARGPAAAAVLAGPHPRRGDAGRLGRVRLLPGGLRGGTGGGAAPRGGPDGVLGAAGLLAPDGGSGGPVGHRAAALHVPAAAPRSAPVPVGLRAFARVGADRRAAGAAGHRRLEDRLGHGEAVRREQLPRLLRAQRTRDAADRGARGVLACPHPRRARLRR